ncbi:Pentatricopeptide repeat protein [Zostera marina]|uniref:Pentatricopeptide repeat protein n=1 Tax=Zostera marina TaxID=29655 RepID=A0A0K9PSK2_ZOSMR|nr:Pentatricopeptide repeat protein [Zostera marina]
MIRSSEWLKQNCTSLRRCRESHALLLRSGLFDHHLYVSKLISFLVTTTTHSFNYAHKIFTTVTSPDLFIWNTMIRGFARSSNPLTSISFFHLMINSGVAPDHHTYPFVLTACARLFSLQLGQTFHAMVIKVRLDSDIFVLNSLMKMYNDCGRHGYARRLFDDCSARDVVSWNVMIGGLINAGAHKDAFLLFDFMIKMDCPVRPDQITVISLVSACAQLGDYRRGRLIHSYIKDWELDLGNLRLGNAVIDMYCKCGDMSSAFNVFDEMYQVDVLTYTSMMSGLTASGRYQESLDLFREMQKEKVRPDDVAIVTVLSACARIGASEQGKYVHLLIERFQVRYDVVVETALVDMYAKCGNLDLALQVFHNMKLRNVFTWNAMITGLAIHGHGRQVLHLFRQMTCEENIIPDDVTFIGVLSGCSHAGLVEEGLRHLDLMMSREYNIRPRIEHYGCVVDLLCRAGLVGDAMTFMEDMPIRPNAALWASVLGACRRVGNEQLAEKVGKRVIELEPDSCGRYLMLSNAYAGYERWDEATKVRNQMKAKGISKIPGMSWTEVDGITHQFVAGDKYHVKTDAIYAMLEEMVRRVKAAAGHVASTSEILFDIEEEEKEHSVFLHSEKLALAFGLMASPPGSEIRIVKNLRVCSDCHSFFKAVSGIFDRYVVARDRSRFHHFRRGVCSCQDYWIKKIGNIFAGAGSTVCVSKRSWGTETESNLASNCLLKGFSKLITRVCQTIIGEPS